MDRIVMEKLALPERAKDLSDWRVMVGKIQKPHERNVTIAIVGKYVNLHDAYLSVSEALKHGGIANDAGVNIQWVNAEEIEGENVDLSEVLRDADGVLVPGGFGERGIEGKIKAIRYARENKLPFFGLCLGMQCAVVEFARNVCALADAHSTEFTEQSAYPVIDIMPEQVAVYEKGGTMRLGVYPCKVPENTLTFAAYKEEIIYERHRHRYEFNNAFRDLLIEHGLIVGGVSPNERLIEVIELSEREHPWFVGTQFHPELKSRPTNPHPLFRDFIAAALKRRAGK